MKSSGCRGWRITGKILLWVFGILVVLRIAIPVGGVAIANRVLPGILGTAASIEGLDMVLLRGRLSVSGITLYQPQGFDGTPLFSLGDLAADVSLVSVLRGPLTVESVTVDKLKLNIIRSKEGVLNVETLAGGSTNAPSEPAETEPEEPSTPMAIAIRELNIHNLSLSYQDLTYDPPLTVQVADCDVALTNLLFDPSYAGEPELNSTVTLTALLKQPDFHDAFVGLVARLGVLTTDPPPMAAAARVVGLELKSGLDAVVPPGVSQTLGGSCIDAYVDLAMAVDVLDCTAEVKTEDSKLGISVGGTPSKPKVDTSAALFNLIRRPGDLVGGVVTDVGSAGVEVVGGAAKTTAAVGKGALKVVGSLGRGVFKTAKGVATADLGEVGEGLKTATIGTVGEVAEGIVDTATTAVEGVGDTATAAIGKDETDAWRAGCEARWEKLWQEARTAVATAPYPRPKAGAEPEAVEPVAAPATNKTAGASVTDEPAQAVVPTPASQPDL